MMRRLLALMLIAAIVALVGFLAGHPGHVEIVWQRWQIDTSAAVLVGLIIAVVLLCWALFALIRGLWRSPRRWRRGREIRRRQAGEEATTRGLVALAAGDTIRAQREAARAAALLGGAPIPLLLAAEAAQQHGDRDGARRSFAKLLERSDTELLGLRGLLGEALKAGDDTVARRFAERARQLQPASPWLAETLLALQARAADWAAARDTLADAARRGALPAERARHARGGILHELSREAERGGDLSRAAALAARAHALLPDVADPALHHARLLLALKRHRAARRAIERAWRTAPHPDLARAYLDANAAEQPLGQAAALQRLAAQNPEALESHIAIAEAALNARLWGEARRHLGLAVAAAPPPGPPRRLCLMMARLEENEPGDPKAAREWLERAAHAPADPCYVCGHCHAPSTAWHPVCSHCGAFDTLAWRVPEPQPAAIAAAIDAPSSPLMLPRPEGSGADRRHATQRSALAGP
ncbi:MAG: heme biosynthesis protein HemY [Alphaproteobacteria bacterium]|nr:heme biosynthesis protein HemY [Alphaproteobacteria bacterium]